MNRYSEFGNDAPTHFLFFFLISELIQSLNKEEKSLNSNQLLLSIFIVLNKITMAFAILLPFIFMKQKNLFKLITVPRNLFAISFLVLWILKNIIVSGCAIYPVTKLCFENLKWTNISQVKAVSQENEAWTKAWPEYKNIKQLSQSQYSSNFNWLHTWSRTHFKKIIKILIPYLSLITIIFFIINFRYKEKKKLEYDRQNNMYLILIFLMVLFSIIWFLKVPVYRYGYSYFVTFIALGFSFICTIKKPIKDTAYNFLNYFLIFFIIIFVLKNIIRIVKPNYNSESLIPKITYLQKSDVKKVNLNNFYYFESNKMCGYGFSPCTHYKNQKLKSKIRNGYKFITVN